MCPTRRSAVFDRPFRHVVDQKPDHALPAHRSLTGGSEEKHATPPASPRSPLIVRTERGRGWWITAIPRRERRG